MADAAGCRQVAQGRRPWAPVVRQFYEPFHQQLQTAEQKIHFAHPAIASNVSVTHGSMVRLMIPPCGT